MSLKSFEIRRKNRNRIFNSSDRVTLQILKSHPVTTIYRPFQYNGDIKCNTYFHRCNAGVIDKNGKTTIEKRLKIKLLFYNFVGLTIYFAFEFFSVNSLKLSRIACQPFCWASIGWVFSASNDSSISVW